MTGWKPDRKLLTEPYYLGIVKLLEEAIASGSLEPGDPLPTHRALSSTLGLSLGTITRAYAEAEQRGLIKGEVGRGTFVSGGPGSALASVSGGPGGQELIDLSLNYPLYSLDPDLGGALAKLSRSRTLQRLLQYQVPGGAPWHRTAGAGWLRGCDLRPAAENVFICAGAQNGITAVLGALARPGDVVFTEELTYPGIKAAAGLLHLRLHGLPMDREGLDPGAFEAAARKRKGRILYCIPTLQNPTGAVMSPRRRSEIARIASKHGIYVVEDDIYRPLVDDPPAPIASYLPDLGFYIASLSKVLAGGLRVAFLASPPASSERVSEALWATHWMVAPLMAEIATAWIADGTARETVAHKRGETRRRQSLLSRMLKGASLQTHPHAFHAWLGLPEPWTSAEFALECREGGVAVTPGSAFTVNADPEAGNGVRICLGAAESSAELEAALERLAGILRSPRRLGPALV